jgi:hypothetical protein
MLPCANLYQPVWVDAATETKSLTGFKTCEAGLRCSVQRSCECLLAIVVFRLISRNEPENSNKLLGFLFSLIK